MRKRVMYVQGRRIKSNAKLGHGKIDKGGYNVALTVHIVG